MTVVQSAGKGGSQTPHTLPSVTSAKEGWKPYPAYKPSSVEWLGDLPEEWVVAALKHRCRRYALYGANIPSDDYAREGVRLLRTTDIDNYGDLQTEGVFISRDQAQDYILADEDILLSRSGTIGRSFVYSLKQHPECAYAGYLVRFVPSGRLNARYFFYFTKSICFSDWLQTQVIASTIGNVNGQKYAQCRLPLPERPEQDAIAAFLDRETGKIDRLVAKKRELIEKLKEERAAIITRTVTRGLNPDAKLKPSGVEWLGNLPETWDAVRLRRRARRIQTGGTPPTVEERYYEDGTIPWFGPGSFDDQIVLTRPVKLLNACVVTEGAARIFGRGATMIVTIGATLGKVSSLVTPASCNQQITVVEYDERRVFPRFATYQIKRLESTLRAIAPSATLPILDQGEIADILLGLPALPEQRAIADFLDRETGKIDRLASKVEDAIERLQEYRAALITAAVIGKIDVREAAS